MAPLILFASSALLRLPTLNGEPVVALFWGPSQQSKGRATAWRMNQTGIYSG
jgi:hypothetical protein